MGQGGGAETEIMPKLVEGYTEPGCSKLKTGKGFLKPNFGLGLNLELVWRRNLPGTTERPFLWSREVYRYPRLNTLPAMAVYHSSPHILDISCCGHDYFTPL